MHSPKETLMTALSISVIYIPQLESALFTEGSNIKYDRVMYKLLKP